MTIEEQKEIIRVCGEKYEETDIPTIIRERDFENEMAQIDAEEREAEELEEEKEEEEDREPDRESDL